jgi:signal transduction histidine kinase
MLRLSLLWAAVSRIVVAVGCGCLGLFLVSGHRLVAASVVTGVLIVWTLVFCLRMIRRRDRERVDGAWLAADVTITCAVLLSQPWVIPLDGVPDGTGWMNALVAMTVVTYQWHTTARVGAVAAVLFVASYWIGVDTSIGGNGGDGGWPAPAYWLLADALLSRGLFVMVRRGGRRADAYLAAGDRERAAAEVSRARRADEREHLAMLHDTAAATLLMVGQGTVPEGSEWLQRQARRDLQMLDPEVRAVRPQPVLDLATMLAETTAAGGVAVAYPPLETLLLPSQPAIAIRDSVREALNNVARHAAVSQADLSVEQEDGRLVVEVRDRGQGFDPAHVPLHRRGIAESIVARMQRAGGNGTVVSSPGHGTVVRLEWADV